MEQLEQLGRIVEANPDLRAGFQNDPVATLQQIRNVQLPPLQTDVWTYRAIVAALSAVAVISVAITGALAFYGKATPEGLMTLGASAVGAMAGVLTVAKR